MPPAEAPMPTTLMRDSTDIGGSRCKGPRLYPLAGTLGKQRATSVQRGVEEVLAIEVRAVAGLLVLHGLQPGRQGLVPFPRQCGDVSEDLLEARFTDIAGQ